MDPSLPRLPLVVALLLGFAQATQATQVSYCGGICPQFNVSSTKSGYQEREYEPVQWMCTGVVDSSNGQVLSAHGRLKSFRNYQQAQGVALSEDTWPGVISVKQTSNGEEYKMCWLIPPGVTVSPVSQFDVTVESFPRTMFVRTFGGTPSIESGHENAQTLKHDLQTEGDSFDPNIFFGVGYDPYVSFTHHNEIWIPKD